MPFISVQQVEFQLQGMTGRETIKISTNHEGAHAESFNLTKEWKNFTYHVPKNQPIIIDFVNDVGDADILLDNAFNYDVIGSNWIWMNQKCGHKGEGAVCQMIRNGVWGHGGKYEIKQKEEPGIDYKLCWTFYISDKVLLSKI